MVAELLINEKIELQIENFATKARKFEVRINLRKRRGIENENRVIFL